MLDRKQIEQVAANRERIRQGRLRTVTLIRTSSGATTYAAAQCTWKEEHNVSSGAANQLGRSSSGPDVTAEFGADVDISTVVAIADTQERAQVADARKYRVLEHLNLGLTGTPNRILVKLVEIR